MTNIPMNTCYNCSDLQKLYIPSTITSIGSNAFYGCSGLSNIYYGKDMNSWYNLIINVTGYEYLAKANTTYNYTE